MEVSDVAAVGVVIADDGVSLSLLRKLGLLQIGQQRHNSGAIFYFLAVGQKSLCWYALIIQYQSVQRKRMRKERKNEIMRLPPLPIHVDPTFLKLKPIHFLVYKRNVEIY